ncbi:MAG: hypothetical protein HOC23_17510 [Halieaceae bacterium]|jgi:putative dimethyl sulfoxide reductase chaperone|nr:hypothetical protein [Halieaceae bacterium]
MMETGAPNDSSDLAHTWSVFFALMAAAFRYPDDRQIALISEGVFCDELMACLAQIAPDLENEVNGSALAQTGTNDDLQLEYTRLFDVTSSAAGCSLHSGFYRGPRMSQMEELLRFYNHFGLSLIEGQSELPDHLTTQLEFLQFLSYCEAELIAKGTDADDQRRAKRDFVARYPLRWLPQLQDKFKQAQAMGFYQELVRVLIAALASEYQVLAQLLGEAGLESTSDELLYTQIRT